MWATAFSSGGRWESPRRVARESVTRGHCTAVQQKGAFKDGIVQPYAAQPGAAEACAFEPGGPEGTIFQHGLVKDGITEVRAVEAAAAQPGAGEVRRAQVRPARVVMLQHGIGKVFLHTGPLLGGTLFAACFGGKGNPSLCCRCL